MYFLGLDVGTSGARAIITDALGRSITSHFNPFAQFNIDGLADNCFEQNPEIWKQSLVKCIRDAVTFLKTNGKDASAIKALSLTSTSGTIVPVDDAARPLSNAIMHNDARSVTQAARVNDAAGDIVEKLGYKFKPTFSLPKILWVKENEPDIFDKTRYFLHAADYLNALITDRIGISDKSNALKSGYDTIDNLWPIFIEEKLHIPLIKLPVVHNTGDIIGTVSKNWSEETGLSTQTVVTAGATDSTCAFFASGAIHPGDLNSTIGSTLVVKAISRDIVKDALGRIYCQVHPEGFWLAGGASNVGGRCIMDVFGGKDWNHYDTEAAKYTPTEILVYPLTQRGERLPFENPDAVGFVKGDAQNDYELFAAYEEGVALTERWCYEVLEMLGVKLAGSVFVTGGAVKGKNWMRIRASVLDKVLAISDNAETAKGAAIAAASRTHYANIIEASENMVRIADTIEPDKQLHDIYSDKFEKLKETCRKRGLIA